MSSQWSHNSFEFQIGEQLVDTMKQSHRTSHGALMTIVAFLLIGFATKVPTTNALPKNHVKLPKIVRSSFPRHFDFGTASAAYQVETHSKLPSFDSCSLYQIMFICLIPIY